MPVVTNTDWNGSNDNWDTTADWSGGLPGSGSTAVIASGQPQITTNVGSIADLTLSGSLALDDGALTVTGAVSKSGSLYLDEYGGEGGSSLTVDGAFANAGELQVGSGNNALSANDLVSVNSLDNTSGQIDLYGSTTATAELLIASAAEFDANAGELIGNVNLGGDAKIVFSGGGQITTIAVNSELSLGGLNGATNSIQDGANGATNSALTGLAQVKGGLYLYNGAEISTTGSLTNTGTIRLDQNGGEGGAGLTIATALVNAGELQVGSGNNALTANDIVQAASLNDTGGEIDLYGSTTATAELLIASAAEFDANAGELIGNVNLGGDSKIVFSGGGQITTIAANGELSLGGPDGTTDFIQDGVNGVVNSALTGLAQVKGGLYLYNGAQISTTGSLTNSGTIRLDQYGGTGGAGLTIATALVNAGELQVGSGNNALTANDTVKAASLNNTGGQIDLYGSTLDTAELLIASAAEFDGNAGELIGNVNFNGELKIIFSGGGQITTIAASGELSLGGADGTTDSIQDGVNGTTNSALTGLAQVKGGLYLYDGAKISASGSLTNTGTIRLDQYGGNGGAGLTIATALVNAGELQVGSGNNALSANDTVQAASLNDTGGEIDLYGSTTATAELLIASAAEFDANAGELIGNVNLSGDSKIVFSDGGQITTIAANSELSLGGPNGATDSIQDGVNGATNSALTGLAQIKGSLNLYNGAEISATGSLTNTGTIRLDQYGGDGAAGLTIATALVNAGELQVGSGNNALADNDTVQAASLNDTGGQIDLYGSPTATAELLIASAAEFDANAGELIGNVNLTGDSKIVFSGGGQITTIAANSELSLGGPNGATDSIQDGVNGATNSALTGLAQVKGSLYVYNGAEISTTGSLTNTGAIRLDQYGGNGAAGLTVATALVNAGELQVGSGNNALAANDTVQAASLNDTGGEIDLYGSATATAELLIASAAEFDANSGELIGDVNLASDAKIIFSGGGQITTIAANSELSLGGPDGTTDSIQDGASGATNSALTGLSQIKGSLFLYNGATITTSGSLLNTNVVSLDQNGGTGAAALGVGGVLTNTGDIQVGSGNYTLSANDGITAKGLVNSGTIALYGSSTAIGKLAVTGVASNNAGIIFVSVDSAFTVDGSYTQAAPADLDLQLAGAVAGEYSSLAVTGGLSVAGGSLTATLSGVTLAANQTYNLATFTSGDLQGVYDTLYVGSAQGPSTDVNLGNNLIAGLVYDDALGNIQLQIVATPASTADLWTAGAGDFATAADWSNGATRFYSDVTIGSTASAAVTLSADATIDSLTINASDSLKTNAGTDLSIGTTLTTAADSTLTIGGEAFVDGAATNNGAVSVTGSVLDIRGAVTGSGAFTIGANAELELGGADAETVTFNGANALLKLDHPSAFSGTLANLAAGDKIDLAGIVVTSPAVTGGTTLTFTDANSNSYSYALTGFPGGAGVVAQSDGAGGTLLTITAPTTTVTLNPIDGDNLITYAQSRAGIAVGGAISGLSGGATFALNIVDGTFSESYTATVNVGGTTWSASLPASALTSLGDGAASFTAYVNAATQASQTVAIHETLPTVTIGTIAGDNVINYAEAHAAGGVALSGTSTGLASGATFQVKLVDGTFTASYTATVGTGGAWTASVPSTDAVKLTNGVNAATFSAQATDAYGNVSATVTKSVSVEELQPTLTINQVDGNDVVNQAQAAAGLTITGGSTGLASGTTFNVSLSDGSFSKSYLATVGAAGAWSASVPATDSSGLGNGANALTVSAQATDAYGNLTNVVSEAVTVEGNPPTLTIGTIAGDNVINSAEANAAGGIALSGTSTGLASGATFQVKLVDGTFSASYTATVGTGGAWTATVPSTDAVKLTNGVNAATFSAQATDAYGNVSATVSKSVSVEETLPTLTIGTVAGDNVINSAEANAAGGIALSGTSTGLASGATFQVKLVDGTFSASYTATVGTGGAWTATVPSTDAVKLTNGVNAATFSAQATDAYGNVSATVTKSVSVEEVLPTLTIGTVAGDNVINYAEASAAGGIALSGTSTGLASGATFQVKLVDGTFIANYTATVGTGGAWTATVPSTDAVKLTNGVNAATVSAQATDAYGNVSATVTKSVSVEELQPTLTISQVDGNDIVNQAQAAAGLTITGGSTGLASGTTFNVSLSDGSFSKSYLATVGAAGAWSASVPAADSSGLGNGANALTVSGQATDAYGNLTNVVSEAVTVEGNPPTLTIGTVAGDNVINSAEANAAGGIALSGTSTGLASGATFQVKLVDGTFTANYTATVGTGGAWTATVPSTDAVKLTNGVNAATFSAQATDAYGNVSANVTKSVSVEEVLPTLTIGTIAGDNVINSAEANAAGGIALSGTSTGLASGATFQVKLVDGTFTASYTATVGSGGAWTATVPSTDAVKLTNGVNAATFSAQATDAYGNVSATVTKSVSVEEALPTLTIGTVAGDNVINYAEANAAGGIALSGTSTGLASGATFQVKLVDGTFAASYTATVGTGGAWTATVPSTDAVKLTNGVNAATFSAQATDAYGNVSATVTKSVSVEEVLPTLTIGTVAGDNVINSAEANAAGGIALSGTSTGLASGATFQVKLVDGTFSASYTATVGTGGAWTATVPSTDAVKLTNGVNAATFSAQATDAYGNVSATVTKSVSVEEVLPTLTIGTIAGDNVINSAEANAAGGVALTGTSTGLASGATFQVKLVDGTFSASYTATVGTGGAWTATVPSTDAVKLTNGVNAATFSAQATDAYGNVSATVTKTVSVEEVLPTLTIGTVAGDNVINSAEANAAGGIALSGTSTGLASGATFQVKLVDGTFAASYTATVGTGGAWTATVPSTDAVKLTNGVNAATFSAQATDAYGNVSATVTKSVSVEEVLPTLTIGTIAGDNVINYAEAHAAGGVALSGTSTGLASGATFQVKLVDGTFSASYTATVGTGGAWTATVPSTDAVNLTNGLNAATFSAQATDAYGNVSATVSKTVSVEEAPPTLTINAIDGDDVINSAEAHAAGGVALSGTSTGLASGATFQVKLVDGTFTASYTATVGTGGAWTATVPSADALQLANGVDAATFSAQATDAYGNVSNVASQSVTVAETETVTLAPVDGDNVINYAEAHATGGVAISGTLVGASLGTQFGVSVVDGAFSKTYMAAVGANGVWTATIPTSDATALQDGTATITANAGSGDTTSEAVKVAETQPTLTAIADTPSKGDLDAGNVVTIKLTSSEPVTVTGEPELALNVGEFAIYDAANSTSTSLAFDYTVQAGDNAPQLVADYVLLSGGSITDGYGNAALLSIGGLAQKGPEIDTQPPVFVGAQETPSTGTLGIGQKVVLYLDTDEAVTVTGAPTLTLNDGGTATYVAGQSTSTKLAFQYVVAVGQTTPDLQASSVNLGGGAIKDLAGNPIDLSLANINQTGPAIQGVQATITAVEETPSTGDYDAGHVVSFSLTMSEAVKVTGAPKLALNDGGSAVYDAAASTGTTLVFNYTVAAGQNVSALQATSVALNGGKIDDAYGAPANLSLTGLAQVGPTIDTKAPTFTAIADNPAAGDLDAGKTVTISLTTSEAVVVTGAPKLTLNDGGTATYDAAKSTSTSLVFDYTVAAGQNTAALKVSAVSLNGGTIKDLAGNAATLSLTGLVQTGPQIDTTAPKIVAVVETPAKGDLDAGHTVTIALTASEAVAVSGAPTLTLNDGGVATYDAAKSTSTSLVFDYTVAAGQNTAALKVSAVNLNGGAIKDLASNAATLSLTGLAQAGPQIDTLAPTITAVTETPATGDLGYGHALSLTLSTSEAVAVTGAPTLALNDGGVATYDAAKSTSTKLVFDYTVGPGENTASLAAVSVGLNGGTILDLAGNAANLSLSGLTQKGPQIDTTPPTVVSIVGTPAAGDLATGQTDTIKVTLSEDVKVTGAPSLILNDGGVASYASGSGSDVLTFSYKVLAGQSTPDLTIVGVNFPTSQSVADLAGNPLVLPGSAADLHVAVNDVLTLSGAETFQVIGPSAQDVAFASGASADLVLTDSQQYTGQISGLTPSDVLDLRDIAFGAGTHSQFTGTATSGTLTVTDGVHSAAIELLGNFTGSTFTLSNDGYGGTKIVDPATGSLAASALLHPLS